MAIQNALAYRKLQQADEKLRQSHADLERRVAERTEELVWANELLKKQIDEQQKLIWLVENSPNFIGVADSQQRSIFVNRAGQQLVGLEGEEEVRQTLIIDYFPEDEQERVRNEIMPALLNKGHWDGEIRFRHFQTGRHIPVSWNVFTIPDPETGDIKYIACVSRSLVEQKRAEELRQTITENASAALFMMDAESRCTYMNRAAEEMTGYTFAETEGRNLHDLIHHTRPDGSRYPMSECPIDRALPEGFEVRDHEDLFVRKDGTFFPVMCAASPIIEDGVAVGTVIEVRNITQEKKAQDALKEADRRKDEFLAMLAHELRNPLAPIRSGLDILAMDSDGNDETLSLMQQQVEHLVRLVDDLLDVSRIVRGKIDLRREPVQLAEIVQRTVAAVRPNVKAKEQDLYVLLPQEPIWLHADPVRLAQVLENLLVNASKYTERGGRIDLGVQRDGDQARISVRDTGEGIEPELLPQVFDLFAQSSRALDRSEGGLGIGLTLVKNLVEMHGGAISAHSEGPGQGSEFTVRLPVEQVEPQVESPEPTWAAAPSRRILVVDDNRAGAKMLQLLLGKLGDHEVEVAYDGPSALEVIESFRPEAVFLDIGLPEMDGYQVAGIIREKPAFNDVLLVALTGYGQNEDRRRSADVGFDEHLVKPPADEDIQRLLVHPKLP